ncbi:hypothetical protein ACFVUW_05865 [Streptomyces xiamenensis]|jgi:hypothetical protein
MRTSTRAQARIRHGWRWLRRVGADAAYGIDAGNAIRHGHQPAQRRRRPA